MLDSETKKIKKKKSSNVIATFLRLSDMIYYYSDIE